MDSLSFFNFLLILSFTIFQIVDASQLVKKKNNIAFGNVVKVAIGKILKRNESFLVNMTTETEEKCWFYCVFHERCLSLNVINVNQMHWQCELFDWTGLDINGSLVLKTNAYHAQLQDHCYGCGNGGTCVATSIDHKCECPIGYKGNHCEKQVYQDCSTLKTAGYHDNGVYPIDPDGKGAFSVLCDMKTEGGGWVVIHKRFNASVSFNRDWNAYKNGFGEMKGGEFWLGNEYIHRITSAMPTKVLIELEDTNGLRSFAKYSTFIVKSEGDLYRLDVSGYSGTAGNALNHPTHPTWRSKGMAFSTPERDNDNFSGSCAGERSAGWWYNWCAAGSLNNIGNMYWNTLSNAVVKKASMKIKPTS